MKKIFKKIWFWAAGLVVVILISAGVFKSNNEKPVTVLVKRAELVQEVSVTGKVQAIDEVILAFERGGKIAKINTAVDQEVASGEVLLELDSKELQAAYLQAQAGLESERAKLQELRRGTRVEEIQIKEAELRKAEQDLKNYYASVQAVLSDGFAKMDDAVRSKTDPIFINDDTNSPQFSFSISDSQTQTDAITLRIQASAELVAWREELKTSDANSSLEILKTRLIQGKLHLAQAENYLVRVLDSVDKSSGLSATTIDTYRSAIGVARTNTNSAWTAINTQEQNISSQEITISKIKEELALKKAGASAEEVAAQEAKVKQAEANLAAVDAQLEQMVLKSPFAGLITKQDAKLGEIIAANAKLVSVISKDRLEVEANVPEVNIGRVAKDNPVNITLDAFAKENFSGKVYSIEPAETIVDGVVNYKVKIRFDIQEERLKTGLTANLQIETLKKENVLVVPHFVVSEINGRMIAKVWRGGRAEEEAVVLGLRGRDGLVEIISGLREGDEVVTETK
jgi:RND family efflux transporter MFP subunit